MDAGNFWVFSVITIPVIIYLLADGAVYSYSIVSHLIVFLSLPFVIDRTILVVMQPEVLQNIGPNFHVSATSEISEQVFHLFLKVLLSAETAQC